MRHTCGIDDWLWWHTLELWRAGKEASSTSIIKRLRLTQQLLLDLSTQHVLLPTPMPATGGGGGRQDGGAHKQHEEMPAARAFLEAVLTELPTLAALPSAALQEEVAACALPLSPSSA